MKYLPAFLCFMLIGAGADAQSLNYIKGKIINGETGAVVPNASVFITNTSKGTISTNTGEFELNNVPEGTYDLVISCISYETQVYTYKPSQLPLRLQVQLKPKAEELQAVVVEPYEKDEWEKWGKFFLENFVGTSDDAKDCIIKNYKVLHFRNSRKKDMLTVTAEEPLIIENKTLGYKIQYQLEGFSYGFQDHVLLFFGYTLFSNLNGKAPKSRQLENRKKAYNGSIAHFMKSLYGNRLAEEGFEIKRLTKTLNLEKDRVKRIYRAHLNPEQSADSSEYYSRVLRQPDMLETYGRSLLTADSLVNTLDSSSKSLFFTNYLYITYKNAKEEASYLNYLHENRPAYYQRSVVFLPNGRSIVVDSRGNYYMPQDLMSYGYWGWSEKLSNMLPLDYE